ncbi:MAG: RimK/LysX family protein [Hyphomicrobiales bacterium]
MTATRPTLFQLPLAGWKEHVHLPKLKLGPLLAKLDTGARSAALHADEVHVQGRRVTFVLINDGRRHSYKAPLAGHKRIKSSNGISELRPVIRATLELGHHVFKTEITLTDRSDMDVPMLLGRETLKGRFVINPARSFLLDRKPRKNIP